jgi:hypothetical protein
MDDETFTPLEETRPPSDEDLAKTKQTYRDKDAVDRTFLRKLLEDRGEWPVE